MHASAVLPVLRLRIGIETNPIEVWQVVRLPVVYDKSARVSWHYVRAQLLPSAGDRRAEDHFGILVVAWIGWRKRHPDYQRLVEELAVKQGIEAHLLANSQ